MIFEKNKMQLTLKVISKPTKEFWQAFDTLAEKTCEFTVQLNSIWLSNYVEYYLDKSEEVYIIAAYNHTELVGCLPLQKTKKRATRFYDVTELKILGFGPTDFFDIPLQIDNKEQIAFHLISFLINDNTWDEFCLTSIPEQSKNLAALLSALDRKKINYKIDKPLGYAFTETRGDWDYYLDAKFNPKNKDLSKSERRVENQGYELEFTTYQKNIYAQLIKNIDLYAQRRESLGQFNNYETDSLKKFLYNIIEMYEAEKMVELTVLNANDEVLAFQLDWLSNRTRFHWNHAYNEDYKRYSPGKLILKELLRKSFENPDIHYCNHMRGIQGYKKKFTENRRMFYRLELENPKSKKIKLTRIISKLLKIIRN